ncbi:MAG: hypothetical protein NTZ37_05055 [Methanoregula sp.]|nr:hypothetical protein [Methanoregula sp.]
MLRIDLIGLEKARSQKCDDFRQVYSGDVIGMAHSLMDMCHRHDAVLEIPHGIQKMGVFDIPGLESDET